MSADHYPAKLDWIVAGLIEMKILKSLKCLTSHLVMVMSLSLIGYCQCTLTCHPAKFGSGDPLKTEDITR